MKAIQKVLEQIREDEVVALTRDLVRMAGANPIPPIGTLLREVPALQHRHAELGIPFVTCGPGNRLIPHQVDEYVEIRELTDAAWIYTVAASKFLEGAKHP